MRARSLRPCPPRKMRTRREHPLRERGALAGRNGRARSGGRGVNILSGARIAIRALRVNKLRSALTMLGIVIGVGAVITMVSVGAGAQARVAEQIASLG